MFLPNRMTLFTDTKRTVGISVRAGIGSRVKVLQSLDELQGKGMSRDGDFHNGISVSTFEVSSLAAAGEHKLVSGTQPYSAEPLLEVLHLLECRSKTFNPL